MTALVSMRCDEGKKIVNLERCGHFGPLSGFMSKQGMIGVNGVILVEAGSDSHVNDE